MVAADAASPDAPVDAPLCLPLPSVRRTPDHPPYAEMIQAAIRTLAEAEGSTASSIDAYIKAEYDDLPWGHHNLFPHYLRKLIVAGEILHRPPDRFLLSSNPLPKREPCWDSSPYAEDDESPPVYSSRRKRGRVRPSPLRFSRSPRGASRVPNGEGEEEPSTSMSKRKRGRPRKIVTVEDRCKLPPMPNFEQRRQELSRSLVGSWKIRAAFKPPEIDSVDIKPPLVQDAVLKEWASEVRASDDALLQKAKPVASCLFEDVSVMCESGKTVVVEDPLEFAEPVSYCVDGAKRPFVSEGVAEHGDANSLQLNDGWLPLSNTRNGRRGLGHGCGSTELPFHKLRGRGSTGLPLHKLLGPGGPIIPRHCDKEMHLMGRSKVADDVRHHSGFTQVKLKYPESIRPSVGSIKQQDQSKLLEPALDSPMKMQNIPSINDGHFKNYPLEAKVSSSMVDETGSLGKQDANCNAPEVAFGLPTHESEAASLDGDHGLSTLQMEEATEPVCHLVCSEKEEVQCELLAINEPEETNTTDDTGVIHRSEMMEATESVDVVNGCCSLSLDVLSEQHELNQTTPTDISEVADDTSLDGVVIALEAKAQGSAGEEFGSKKRQKVQWKSPKHRPEPPKLRPRIVKE